MRDRLSYANVMSTLGVGLALTGGTALAIGINAIGSKQIQKGAVKRSDIAKNAVASRQVAPGSLIAADFAPDQLPQGPQGDTGPAGADGTEITPIQTLDKVKQADGRGSGLDADTVDGVESAALARGYTFAAEITANTLENFVELPGLTNGLDIDCSENPGPSFVQIQYEPPAGSSRAFNLMATSDGIEAPHASGADQIGLSNGTQRFGSDAAGGTATAIVADVAGGASSELQLIVEENGETMVVNAHVRVRKGAVNSSCDASGSVMTGPTLP